LPSRREEIESALKYLKNNKAAGADVIAADLLKNGCPPLVDALEEVFKLAWRSETLPESRIKGVLCRENENDSRRWAELGFWPQNY
jgi:coenzyme F420-reducing hydrogenase gamma subunit